MDRLQKVLAHAGIASRRKCEELIVEGRVTVDGEVCKELGMQVDPDKQIIAVDGQTISLETKTCILLHKPTSYVTTVSDPEGRRTVMDLIDKQLGRLYPIGRLDYETSGILLLTNDGELANRLMHPSHKVEKTYRVTVIGMPEKSAIKTLTDGVPLEDGETSPAKVEVLRNHPQESVIEITIREGRNRQVRRMFDYIGCPVKRLKRVAYGPLELGDLPPGKSRLLTAEEWAAIYKTVGLDRPTWPGTPAKPSKNRAKSRNGQSHGRRHGPRSGPTSQGQQQRHKDRQGNGAHSPDTRRRGRKGQSTATDAQWSRDDGRPIGRTEGKRSGNRRRNKGLRSY